MTNENKYLAILCFQNKVLRSTGNMFEDLFSFVMELANTDFHQVKPQGALGDRKNDGFDSKTGTYYQVYAPEDLASNEEKAIAKLYNDFEILKKFWPQIGYPVKSFYYVLNDKYKGVGPGVFKNIQKLRDGNPDIGIDLFLTTDLQRLFENLDEIGMMKIIGVIPNADISILSLDVLHSVIVHVMNSESKAEVPFIPVYPNMLKKIEFNGLSNQCSVQLQAAMININSINDYFANNNNYMKDELRNRFNSFYIDAKSHLDNPDQIFAEIYSKALPRHATQAHSTAVIILMSYFFECCDIFESQEK